ncbi:MAG: saccharopine dehydrogenase NADP-binding domain-containing protein [Candidatus Sigynarchaeota archaeon]
MGKSVLVLGAYGHVGRCIVPELVKMAGIDRVVATGRIKTKLESCFSGITASNLELRTLDVFDKLALQSSCQGMDLVINCVGPYAWRGSEITTDVITNGVNYIDFANEQSHYRRLQRIAIVAEQNGLVLVTGAGTSPGISTMLFQKGKEAIPAATTFEMFYASGRHPTREEGFGSVMGAIVETGFDPVAWIGGKPVKMPLGKEYRSVQLPAPYGACNMISFPTIDALIVPKMLGAETVNTFWSMGNIPFGLPTLIKLFKPHKREWAYEQFAKLVRSTMNRDYDRAVRDSLGIESIMLVTVSSASERWEATMTFPKGGGAAASYMALLAAKKVLSGRVKKAGLVTPGDGIATPTELIETMHESGWTGKLESKTTRPVSCSTRKSDEKIKS